jgi:hypothetical protein
MSGSRRAPRRPRRKGHAHHPIGSTSVQPPLSPRAQRLRRHGAHGMQRRHDGSPRQGVSVLARSRRPRRIPGKPGRRGAGAARARVANPLEGARFHVDAEYTQRVASTAAQYPALASQVIKAGAQPTAVWIDAIARIPRASETLDAAAKEGVDGRGGPWPAPPVLAGARRRPGELCRCGQARARAACGSRPGRVRSLRHGDSSQ